MTAPIADHDDGATRDWPCPRCGSVVTTRDAAPRCPTCGHQDDE
jgi:rubrerythrin